MRSRKAPHGRMLPALAAALLLLPSAAHAQIVTARGNPATTQITFTGELTSAVELVITGSTDSNGNDQTELTGSGAAGVVNFGIYNLATPLLTGEKNRTTSGTPGTYLVATLRAQVFTSGGHGGAVIDIARTFPYQGPPDVPQQNLFFAFWGIGNIRIRNTQLWWPNWTRYPNIFSSIAVFEVPPAGTVPGGGNLDPGLQSGDFIDHQIAVWIPDSQPAGPFSTTVTYTATAL